MGLSRGEQAAEVDASPDACFEAIVDYESFPDWQHPVERAEVIERYPEGLVGRGHAPSEGLWSL